MEPVHDCMQMRYSVSHVESVGTVTTVLCIKISGQKIVDYVERKLKTCTVNNLQAILLTVKIISTSTFLVSFFLLLSVSLSFRWEYYNIYRNYILQINFIDYLS
jgi:hypothetical protein